MGERRDGNRHTHIHTRTHTHKHTHTHTHTHTQIRIETSLQAHTHSLRYPCSIGSRRPGNQDAVRSEQIRQQEQQEQQQRIEVKVRDDLLSACMCPRSFYLLVQKQNPQNMRASCAITGLVEAELHTASEEGTQP